MRKEFKFKAPELVLLLTCEDDNSSAEKIFQKAIDQTNANYVVLSLMAEKKYFKKIVTAAKLMDIRFIFFEDNCVLHSGKLSGKKTELTDTIILGKNKVKSLSSIQLAYKSFIRKLKTDIGNKNVLVIGNTQYAKPLITEIKNLKPGKLSFIDRKYLQNRSGTRAKKIASLIHGSEIYFFCGPSHPPLPSEHLFNSNKKSNIIIDVRTGFAKCSVKRKKSGTKPTSNRLFLTHLFAEKLKILTNKSTDLERIAVFLKAI